MIHDGLGILLREQKNQFDFLSDDAASGREAITKIKKSHYDIVLMDYKMPELNGAETTRQILTYNPDINVLALSNYNEIGIIKSFQQAGARGYLLKNANGDEFNKAITTVLNKEYYYSGEVLALMNENKKTPSGKTLNEKEFEILTLIARHYNSRQIAAKLFLSIPSISKYRRQLLRKMQVKNTENLLIEARRLTLID
jgi:DNA-binding NarL/FixJ family response regulator